MNRLRAIWMSLFLLGALLFFAGNSFAATLEAGYNDNNGNSSGYLNYDYTVDNFNLDLEFIKKDNLISTDLSGSYFEQINEAYNLTTRLHLIDNPRLGLTTLSMKLGLNYLLLMDKYTALNLGYGLDAFGVKNESTLFSVYYDAGLFVELKNFSLQMSTFGNGKIKVHTAEAAYKFTHLKSTSAGLKYTLTDFKGISDYYLTTFIKAEF